MPVSSMGRSNLITPAAVQAGLNEAKEDIVINLRRVNTRLGSEGRSAGNGAHRQPGSEAITA